ncbi:MAG: hypothetical protein KDA96_04880 [Planctomycetaceae bacterium]|nr:hypothetical protein [Planctomycetaceae bacterium]
MAEMTIRLQTDPVTGRKDIIISLKSDEDLLPHEHEQQHRAIVNKLIEGGIINAAEAGKLIVEREAEAPVDETNTAADQQGHRQSLDEGA